MARIRKENINTSFFHIMVQGINQEHIFDAKEDTKEYLQIMLETKEKINTMILAYCIMKNHAHILFHEEKVENLTKYMHRVNLLYAKHYNKKYKRVGYVFRDRYRTQSIYSENQLYTCVRYIHNNPVKAKICNKPTEYQYSSCHKNIFYTNTQLEKNVKENMYFKETKENTSFVFMEDYENKEQICKETMEEIMIKNHLTKEDLYHNEQLVVDIAKKLKVENGISYRMIETELGINRKKLKKMVEQQITKKGGEI